MLANRDIAIECAQAHSLRRGQIDAVAELLAEGATIPFIARYRKERTGSLDEEVLRAVRDMLASLQKRVERRQYIGAQIESQGKMTEELAAVISAAETLAELEDLYMPFKRTIGKAIVAVEPSGGRTAPTATSAPADRCRVASRMRGD